jgi:hypothetical protein
MKKYIIAIALFTSGCTQINGNLIEGLTELQDLKNADATICRGGWIQTGMDCAELTGMPRFVHPAILYYGACTVNWHKNGKVDRSVIFTSSDLFLGHELDHIRGIDDTLAYGVESEDPETVAKFSQLAKQIEASGNYECVSYKFE